MRRPVYAAIALIATACLAGEQPSGVPVPPAGAAVPAATAAAPAGARIAELESKVNEQAAEIATLRADLERCRAWMDSVALPIRSLPAAKGPAKNIAPSSGLDAGIAGRAALAARLMVRDGAVLNVLPTGSMRPTFDQNAILLTEPASFDDIRVGDIVTFRHPAHPVPVVHRVLEKRGDRFWSRGDANGRMDDIYITRENFDRRVFGIIYASEPVKPVVAK